MSSVSGYSSALNSKGLTALWELPGKPEGSLSVVKITPQSGEASK